MRITYLEHSGFAVEWDACVWVFDYYRGQIPKWDRGKSLVVFASHAHKDHFVPEIFLKFGDFQEVKYVLSSDIRKKIRKMQVPDSVTGKIHYMSPGERWEMVPGKMERMTVEALDSTDCGVAFLIEYCGRRIFHAGDLNCWVWEEDTKAERNSMTARYRREVGRLSGQKIDCAFLPLDYRLGEAYDMGIRYFLDHVTVSHVFPMHLWGRYSIAEKFRNSLEDPVRQGKIVPVEYPGQQWEYGVVKEIVEPDFGCEGRQDGAVVTDQVVIRLEDQTEIKLEIEDRLLYERQIDEGSSVLIESKGVLRI